LYIGVSFLDRDAFPIYELLLATIQAIEGAELPLGHVHTAPAQEETDPEYDDPEECDD
jgi:hypothetical protein